MTDDKKIFLVKSETYDFEGKEYLALSDEWVEITPELEEKMWKKGIKFEQEEYADSDFRTAKSFGEGIKWVFKELKKLSEGSK